jgi:hypothetical protein
MPAFPVHVGLTDLHATIPERTQHLLEHLRDT